MSNIRQLEERVVATEITLMRWSDRMDLLALANTKGEVLLQRLSWQKVWVLPPETEDSTVIDMNWRPDGKIIAVAYDTGNVLLIEVENKNTLRTIKIEEDISCISWLQDKNPAINLNATEPSSSDSKPGVESSSKYLPDLPSLQNELSSASKNLVENLVDLNFVKYQNDLNILIIGTRSGNLHISIFGLFTCACIKLSSYLSKPCAVLNLHMAENLSALYVIVNDNDNNLYTIVLDTSIISAYSKELFQMAIKHGHLISLLLYLENTMSSITEAWESILLEMDSKLSKYASNVPEGTVSADFLDLLMFGISSDEMEEFLMQDLTDKGLKKLGHSIELSYSNIQKLLLKHLTKVGQNITYHLAELRGMARFTHRYKNLGLNEKTITSAIIANGAFMVKGVEVQQVINHSMTNYKAFFRWLYVVILRLMDEQIPPEIPKMAQQDLAYITEFLQNFDSIGNTASGQTGRFNLERLGQYLLDAPLTILPKNDHNIWYNFLEENQKIVNHESIIKHYKSMSLVQQHKFLIKSIVDVFDEPNEKISSNFVFKLNFPLLNVADLKKLSITQLNYNESTNLIAFTDGDNKGVYLLEFSNFDEISVKCVYIFSSHIPECSNANLGTNILDVHFYSVTYLTVLIEDTNRTSYLCQIPIAQLKSHLVDISLDGLMSQEINKIDLCELSGIIVKEIEGMNGHKFSITCLRHVCVVLSENQRKVQLFEMEAEEDEEELDDTYVTATSTHDAEAMLQESISDGS